MKSAALAASVLALTALTGSQQALAQAQYPAFTSKPVNLRAGPSRDYPVIAVLPPGFQVLVQGCLSDFAWCDVVTGYDRGWVYAGNIFYNMDNNVQPIITWGPMIGVGVIGFAFDDYWPRYYRNRPWYRERQRWENVRPPRHAGPRPPLPAPLPGWQQPRVQPHPHPMPQAQPQRQPQPQFQPRPVPPQPQVQPRPVPQPAQPPGQAHPGFRGAPPAQGQPPAGAPPRVERAPHQDRPTQPRGGEHRAPPQQQQRQQQQQQQQQEREHG
jgi:uncharacterized protein YraI